MSHTSWRTFVEMEQNTIGLMTGSDFVLLNFKSYGFISHLQIGLHRPTERMDDF